LCGVPSAKRVKRLCDKITGLTGRERGYLSEVEMAGELNLVLSGWANYFCMGPVSGAYRKINSHVRWRFRQWWEAKHKVHIPDPRFHWSLWLEQTYGLLELKWDSSRLPRTKA